MSNQAEGPNEREERLNAVRAAYLELAEAGCAPDQDVFLACYPDLADDLRAYFATERQIASLAGRPRGAGVDDGKPFADYEYLEKINEGGMGIVYKAWHRGLKRWEAVKKIKPNRLATEAAVRRFRVEIEAVARLDHPHIVPIYDVREYRGFPYFSMKFFENGSLQNHLTRFTNPRAAVKLLATVAEAVHYAHQRGILHRDLKPANILLDAQEQPHVADFGLAKRLPAAAVAQRAIQRAAPGGAQAASPVQPDETPDSPSEAEDNSPEGADLPEGSYLALEQADSGEGHTATLDASFSTLTPTGVFVGTFPYVAPEQATGQQGGPSAKSDVYSLGVILYKLLTGRPTFKAQTLKDAVRQLLKCEPDRPSVLDPRVDLRLEWICLKCLRKDPAERYASAEALAEDLKRWLRGEWPLGYPIPWWARAARAVRRNALTVTLAIVLSFAAATLFFVFYWFDPDRVPRDLEAAATKGPVTLIGMTGPPVWSRWNLGGDGAFAVSSEHDKPFSFTTGDRGRLELMRQAPSKGFRFSAEVRHDRALEFVSLVGIYFGNTRRETQDDLERCWCDLTFADLGGMATINVGPDAKKYGALTFELERNGPPIYTFTRLGPFAKELFFSAQLLGQAGNWRRLAVEVTSEKIKLFWEGKSFQEVCRAELHRICQSSTPVFEFAPEMALGLYVFKGKASFRQVTITPLE